MAWTYTYDTNTPLGSASPTSIDDRIREAKVATQERMNVEHYWPLTGTEVSDLDAGQHRFITLHEAIATPTLDSGETAVYSKDVGEPLKPELHFLDEDADEVQITSGGALLIGCDDSTIEQDSTNGVQLKDGGITYAKLATGSGCCDNATTEVSASGIAIKVPAGGDDTDAVAAPVIAYGSYAGSDSADKVVDTKITIKHLVIKSSDGMTAAEVIVSDDHTHAWRQGSGEVATGVTVNGTEFTATKNVTWSNDNGKDFTWFAIGVRP